MEFCSHCDPAFYVIYGHCRLCGRKCENPLEHDPLPTDFGRLSVSLLEAQAAFNALEAMKRYEDELVKETLG